MNYSAPPMSSEAALPSPAPRARVAFIDAARVFAMLLMLQGHVCDTLLLQSAKATEFFKLYWNIRGITGPLFYTLGGFALVVASDSRWSEYGRPGPKLYARLRRAGVLMLIGYLLQVPRWSGFLDYTTAEWRYVFRSGVLHCVAWSMLLCHLMIALTPNKRAFTAVVFGAALLVLVGTPFVAALPIDQPVLFAQLLHTRDGSLFPLFPYIAYFFFGAGVARLFLDWKTVGTPLRIGLPLFAIGGAMLWGAAAWRAARAAAKVAAPHWSLDPTVFLTRMGAAWLVFGAFALLLSRVRRSPPWLADLGGRALSVYVAHLVILYGVPRIPGLVQRVGPTISLTAAFIGGPLLLVASSVASIGFDKTLELAKALLDRGYALVRERFAPAVAPTE